MLSLSLSCAPVQAPTIRLLCGGMTQTIFPLVESYLREESDREKALEFVAAKKNMDRYESVMDFLFCEVFPSFRNRCFAYYEDREKPLREIITEGQRQEFEKLLLCAVKHAYKLFCEERQVSWVRFRSEALGLLNRVA